MPPLFPCQTSSRPPIQPPKRLALPPQYNAVSGAVSLVNIGQDVQRQLKSGTITEEQAAQVMVQHAEKSLAALWKINVMDIERVLELVCMNVLQDTSGWAFWGPLGREEGVPSEETGKGAEAQGGALPPRPACCVDVREAAARAPQHGARTISPKTPHVCLCGTACLSLLAHVTAFGQGRIAEAGGCLAHRCACLAFAQPPIPSLPLDDKTHTHAPLEQTCHAQSWRSGR